MTKGILKTIAQELAPNLVALIFFLIVAQVIFFSIGQYVLVANKTKTGLFLINFVFAVLIPYFLAMLIKAIKLIIMEVNKKKK